MKNWLGIDLGKEYCHIALQSDQQTNEDRNTDPLCQTLPAVAYVTRGDTPKIIIGTQALSYQGEDPERFFPELLTELGNENTLFPNEVLRPLDLIAALFKQVLAIWEHIDQVFIAMEPGILNNQLIRKHILDAAERAGFPQVELIPRPLAAAYFWQQFNAKPGLSLVYDLDTDFKATLVDTCENYSLMGSENSGTRILEFSTHFENHLLQQQLGKISNADALDHHQRLSLLQICRQLAYDLGHEAQVSCSHNGILYSLSQIELNDCLDSLLDKTHAACHQLLKSCNREWSELVNLLPVGCYSRLPLVQRKLESYLNVVTGTKGPLLQWPVFNQNISPIYAICQGAARKKSIEKIGIMNPEIYEIKRNRLASILDSVLAIKSVPEPTRKRIQNVRDKSVSNQFEVVLIGEFQGGKSTTFNALCDGREISPRGAMIKTSACKISASNLVDPQVEEYVSIHWRTPQELLLSIVGLIEPLLRKADPKRFLSVSLDRMVHDLEQGQNLDLKNAYDLQLIRDALKETWKSNRKDRDFENLDVLRIASLIANFVDDPYIGNLIERERFSLVEMAQLVTFPKHWEARWQGYSPENFQAHEVGFAFIASVKCFLHSPNLARLGCVITDCPGLFASRWDTQVAQQAMYDADAILYLMGGERAMTQGDLTALNAIRGAKMDHKLFFAINVKGNQSNVKNNIRTENASLLVNRGFKLDKDQIYLFHALLSLCANNGRAMLENRLDPHSQAAFISTAKKIDERHGDDIQVVWRRTASASMRRLDDFAEEITGLDRENVERLAEAGGLDAFMDHIESTVISKKAYAILVSQGAEKARLALREAEGQLKVSEESARKTVQEFEAASVLARNELDKYQEKVKQIISNLDEEVIGIPLAEKFENHVVLDNIHLIAAQAARDIKENLLNLASITKQLWGSLKEKLTNEQQNGFEMALRPILENAINQVCIPAAQGWVTTIKQGDCEIYNSTIGREVEEVNKRIDSEWQKVIEHNQKVPLVGLLDGLEIERPLGTLSANEELFQALDLSSIRQGVNGASKLVIAGNVYALFIGASSGAASSLIVGAILIGVGLGSLPAIVLLIPAILGGGFAGVRVMDSTKEKAAKKIEAKIQEGLLAAFTNKEAKRKLREQSITLVSSIRGLYISYFESRLKLQEKAFEDRILEAQKNFEKSEAERLHLAEKLSRVRIHEIEPARGLIDDFLHQVLPMFSNTAKKGEQES